ncbi:MAG: hypothetical protein KC618_01730, partial [Candidatus Omnitrophica bacterium]|nr:hypothetical protein [Candidatus Omnitrophota bacterium]
FMFVIPLVLLCSACSIYHINSEDVSSDFYYPKASINDVVYIENIQEKHEVIGFITVNTERNQRLSEVMQKLKREAAILGADAITDIKSDATGQWKKLPAQEIIGNGYVRANFTASAVVFK